MKGSLLTFTNPQLHLRFFYGEFLRGLPPMPRFPKKIEPDDSLPYHFSGSFWWASEAPIFHKRPAGDFLGERWKKWTNFGSPPPYPGVANGGHTRSMNLFNLMKGANMNLRGIHWYRVKGLLLTTLHLHFMAVLLGPGWCFWVFQDILACFKWRWWFFGVAKSLYWNVPEIE